ncbi:histidinol-phosphate transaminase [bacterium E08(2017)]|nr:histidinol-phosphate transaminase [bacterium E08(2017)]
MGLIRNSVNDMEGYVPGEQPDDPDIVKLNTNENPYPPSPKVIEALKRLDADRIRLYPNPVSSELRDRVAVIHGCRTENVFVGNGSDEVLALCTRAFVENDGLIGYLDPSYSLYPVLADIREVEKKTVPLNEDFSWDIPSDFEASLFMLTNPNAPTGLLASKSKIREFCKSFSKVVLVDEAYVDFASEDCVELALSMENVLVARTLSKSYSMAGLRVGYVIGHKNLIEALYKIKDSYNIDMISQALALAALSDVEYMKSNAARIIATRERLSEKLTALGWTVIPSNTNFLWVRPVDVTAKDLFERLRNVGILLRYFDGERTGDYLRITIGTDEEIDKLIDYVKSNA